MAFSRGRPGVPCRSICQRYSALMGASMAGEQAQASALPGNRDKHANSPNVGRTAPICSRATGQTLGAASSQTAKSPAFAGLSAMARGRLELPTLGL